MSKLLPMPENNSRFGQWVVLDTAPDQLSKSGARRKMFLCACDCGTFKEVPSDSLRSGNSRSCGCLRSAMSGTRTHGKSKTPIYAIWNMMNQRCRNPSYRLYQDYGGRGITVCERWQTFENFYADVGDAPFKGASLERKDNDGPYEPQNCEWANRKTQSRNKRNNRLWEFRGQSKVLVDWAQELGVSPKTLASRLYIYGWSVEKAFTTPVTNNTYTYRHVK